MRKTTLRDATKQVVKLLLKVDLSVINLEDDAKMSPIEYAIDSEQVEIKVVKIMQKASEKEWKRKVAKERLGRTLGRQSSAPVQVLTNVDEANKGEVAPAASRRSSSQPSAPSSSAQSAEPVSLPPISGPAQKQQVSRQEPVTQRDQDARKAIADILGSVNLAAVSSALDKTGDKDPSIAVEGRINVHIPFKPRKRTSPRTMCA